MPIRYYKQKNDYYCGPACLQMVLSHFGIRKSQDALAKAAKTNHRTGTTRNNLIRTLCQFGINAQAKNNLTIFQLRALAKRHVCIVNYPELDEDINHYAVISTFTKTRVVLHDPWHGSNYALPIKIFSKRWKSHTYKKTNPGWVLVGSKEE